MKNKDIPNIEDIVLYYGQNWDNVKHMKNFLKELKERYIREVWKMGTKPKNDKLDIIASMFENETFTEFNLCCEDETFKQLLLDNSKKPINDVVSILTKHANNYLI